MMTAEITDQDFAAASAHLAGVVRGLAHADARRLGVRMRLAADAPNSWEALCAEGERMRATGVLTIWNGASDTAVYGVEGNYLFRFWHDLGHLETGLTFDRHDERELQVAHHLPVIEAAGLEPGSLPHRLYVADTIGQIEHYVTFGDFPTDQRAFVRHLASTGEIVKF